MSGRLFDILSGSKRKGPRERRAMFTEVSDEEVVRAIRSVPTHFTTTTLYFRSDTAATGVQSGTLPSAWQANWTVADEPTLSGVQKALSLSAGSSQQSTANNRPGSGGVGNQVTPPWYQLISGNVTAGSYASSSAWAVGIAFVPAGTLNGLDVQGVVAVYLFKNNGTLRTTLQSGTVFGGARNCTTASELTIYTAALTCSAFTASAGDYLVVEIGYQSTNNGSSSVSQNGTYYDCGTTVISSDGASTTQAQSFIQAPFANLVSPTATEDAEQMAMRIWM